LEDETSTVPAPAQDEKDASLETPAFTMPVPPPTNLNLNMEPNVKEELGEVKSKEDPAQPPSTIDGTAEPVGPNDETLGPTAEGIVNTAVPDDIPKGNTKQLVKAIMNVQHVPTQADPLQPDPSTQTKTESTESITGMDTSSSELGKRKERDATD